MKIRNGFVSNSSSSSFTVPKSVLTEFQIWAIKHHVHATKTIPGLSGYFYDYPWNITETDDAIEGYTDMDNFDMIDFMKQIGVYMNAVKFGGDNY